MSGHEGLARAALDGRTGATGTVNVQGEAVAEDVATARPYTARYAGSLVTDFHRILREGGGTDRAPASTHQCVPLIVGSPDDLALAEDFYAQRR